jgi:hypothetical protein
VDQESKALGLGSPQSKERGLGEQRRKMHDNSKVNGGKEEKRGQEWETRLSTGGGYSGKMTTAAEFL